MRLAFKSTLKEGIMEWVALIVVIVAIALIIRFFGGRKGPTPEERFSACKKQVEIRCQILYEEDLAMQRKVQKIAVFVAVMAAIALFAGSIPAAILLGISAFLVLLFAPNPEKNRERCIENGIARCREEIFGPQEEDSE